MRGTRQRSIGRFACPSGLRGSPIRPVEATAHRERPRSATTARMRRGGRSVARDALPNPQVRSVLREIRHVFAEHAPQEELDRCLGDADAALPESAADALGTP